MKTFRDKKNTELTLEKEISTETSLINHVHNLNNLKEKKHSFQVNHTQLAKGIASLMLIYSPLFIRLFHDINYKSKICPIMIFYLFYFIIRHIQRSYKMKGLINIVFHYFN